MFYEGWVEKSMFDGFFGSYAMMGLVLFIGSLIFMVGASVAIARIFKRDWIFSVIMLFASILLYFFGMVETALFYFGLFILGLLIYFYKKYKTNEKN